MLTRLLALSLCCTLASCTRAQGPRHADARNADQGAGRPPAQQYTLVQAMSDQAQLHTIAFNGLAFITGEFGASTFLPPGKVCDFFGFQYMRDIDAAQKGHNPMFLDRVAANVLHVLNTEQTQQFDALAAEQAPQLQALAEMRFPLIKAFHRQLEGDIPDGSTGLNQQAVIDYVGDIFALDAEFSYRRAQVMAQVARSLTPEQSAYLGSMKFGDFSTWPDIDMREQMPRRPGNRDPLYNVACMTYASEFFSWTAGSVEADTYFCPERHGTYFGGFYMKDMPAMGKRDYDISTSVTGDSGAAFLGQVLAADQRQDLTAIPDLQREALGETARVRRAIATQLRVFLDGQTPDRAEVVALGRRYGELDGEMSWYYATAFAAISATLTADQRAALMKLRNLEGYVPAPAYIYSRAVSTPPTLPDTDSFFFPPQQQAQGVE